MRSERPRDVVVILDFGSQYTQLIHGASGNAMSTARFTHTTCRYRRCAASILAALSFLEGRPAFTSQKPRRSALSSFR